MPINNIKDFDEAIYKISCQLDFQSFLIPLLISFFYLYIYPFVIAIIDLIYNLIKTRCDIIFSYKHYDYAQLLNNFNFLKEDNLKFRKQTIESIVKLRNRFHLSLIELSKIGDYQKIEDILNKHYEYFVPAFHLNNWAESTSGLAFLLDLLKHNDSSLSRLNPIEVKESFLKIMDKYKLHNNIGSKDNYIVLNEKGILTLKLFLFDKIGNDSKPEEILSKIILKNGK